MIMIILHHTIWFGLIKYLLIILDTKMRKVLISLRDPENFPRVESER